MVICVCSNVTETDLKSYVDSGLNCKEIIQKTGACSNCKICCSSMKETVKKLSAKD